MGGVLGGDLMKSLLSERAPYAGESTCREVWIWAAVIAIASLCPSFTADWAQLKRFFQSGYRNKTMNNCATTDSKMTDVERFLRECTKYRYPPYIGLFNEQ